MLWPTFVSSQILAHSCTTNISLSPTTYGRGPGDGEELPEPSAHIFPICSQGNTLLGTVEVVGMAGCPENKCEPEGQDTATHPHPPLFFKTKYFLPHPALPSALDFLLSPSPFLNYLSKKHWRWGGGSCARICAGVWDYKSKPNLVSVIR